jgi:glycosyltransferase involved in cell wall biosynthesis
MNIGLTSSLNKALNFAKGKYIARQDADDISLLHRFEKEVQFLERNRDYGMVCSNFHEIDSKGDIKNDIIYDNFNFKKELIKRNPVFHSSIMVRKSILDRIGHYSKKWKYAQDYELYFRVLKISKIKVLKDFLCKRRYDNHMISIKKMKEQRYYALKSQIKAMSHGYLSFSGILATLKNMVVIIMPSQIRAIIKKIKGEYWFEKD